MDTLQRKVTFDEATQEIHANERAIAQAISQQANSGDTNAWALADWYRKGTGTAGEMGDEARETARTEFLTRYEVWRTQFAALVAPIAASLNNPVPGSFATASAQPVGVTDMFTAPAAAVAPPQTGPAAAPHVSAGQNTETTGTAAPTAAIASANGNAEGNKRRRTLSQKDVVALTQAMLAAGPAGPDDRAAWFVQNVRTDMTIEDVLSKAVELELIPGDATAGASERKYEMSDTDKRVLDTRVRTQLVVVDNPQIRLIQLKFAATLLREYIKELQG